MSEHLLYAQGSVELGLWPPLSALRKKTEDEQDMPERTREIGESWVLVLACSMTLAVWPYIFSFFFSFVFFNVTDKRYTWLNMTKANILFISIQVSNGSGFPFEA